MRKCKRERERERRGQSVQMLSLKFSLSLPLGGKLIILKGRQDLLTLALSNHSLTHTHTHTHRLWVCNQRGGCGAVVVHKEWLRVCLPTSLHQRPSSLHILSLFLVLYFHPFIHVCCHLSCLSCTVCNFSLPLSCHTSHSLECQSFIVTPNFFSCAD